MEGTHRTDLATPAVSNLRTASEDDLATALAQMTSPFEDRSTFAGGAMGDVPPGARLHEGAAPSPNLLGNAEWVRDNVVTCCARCSSEFQLSLRRHHCRQCGQIFCYRCCSSKALLQPGSGTALEERVVNFWGASESDVHKPQRVCSRCFDALLPLQV